MGKIRNRERGGIALLMVMLMTVSMFAGFLTCEDSYAALKTTRTWGKDITDSKLNKYNGKSYYFKLPGVNQYMCTGYVEWALNSVYGVKVPGYGHTRDLREYLIKKDVKIVAYGSHVAKAQGGNGKYYSYGEIKPGDIVFFFKRGTNSKGRVTKSPIKNSRGYTNVDGWRHVAIVGGSVSGSHGITSKLHHNTRTKGIHYSGTIKTSIGLYSDEKGATDYQVLRLIEEEPVKRPVKIIKTMSVNGNKLPEESAVFRIWPKSYGKYSSKSSWWKKIPKDSKDEVKTGKDGTAVTKALPTASGSFNGKYYIHQTKGPGNVSLAKNKQITLKSGTKTVNWSYTDKSSEHPEIIKKDAVSGDAVTQEGITFRLKRKGAFRDLQEALGLTVDGSDEDESQNDGQNEGETEGGEQNGNLLLASDEQSTEEGEAAPEESQSAEESGGNGNEEGGSQEGGEGESQESEEDAGGKSKYGFDDADAIVKAFLSDDPEAALKALGITIVDPGWVSIGGQTDFTTDDTGTAEISKIGENEPGEYEVYEVKAPAGYKLPGYSVAASDPDAASELDLPVEMELESLASTTSVELYDMPDPEIMTNAVDDITQNHVGSTVENAGITDTVTYENLEKDKGYTLFGTLMFKDSGEPVKDSSGEEITGMTSFAAEDISGSEKVEFSFDGRLVGGRDVVVFERLYEGDFDEEPENTEPLARHEDITDEDQTVSYPEPPDEPEEPDEFDEPDEPDGPDEPDEPDKPGTTPKKTPRKSYGIPKTGDDQLELVLLLITVLAAAVVILTIITLTYRDKSRAKMNRKEWGK